MRSDRKQTILFITILLILSMGIGYAFLTTTLSIDGVSDIDSASWNVHWDNLQVMEGSITGNQVISPAAISVDGHTISYHIKLNEPGDHYVLTVDAVNAGTLDAMIEDVIVTINDEPITDTMINNEYYFLDFSYGLFDGTSYASLSENIYLRSGETIKYFFNIGYNYYIRPEDLPTENQSINLSIKIIYSQASEGRYLYTNDFIDGFNNSIRNFTTYDNYQDAMNASGKNVFVRIYVIGNLIYKNEVGFKYNNQVYILDGETIDDNKEILNNIFDSSMCQIGTTYEYCYDEDNHFEVRVKSYTVEALQFLESNDTYMCNAYYDELRGGCGIVGDH